MKWYLRFLLALCCPLIAAIDSSIMPAIESAYQTDYKGFSNGQRKEIEEALKGVSIRVITYNMLFNCYDFRHPEEYRWPARCPRIAELILALKPDVIASQELYKDQLEDLLILIGEQYAFYGTSSVNADGSQSELNGIFYNKKRLEKVYATTLFMSLTPDCPSAGPFDRMARTLIGVHLRDVKTGKVVGIYNAHHSFGSADSREYSTRFTLNHLASLSKEMPLIIAGDFNTFPTRTDLQLPFYDGHYLAKLFRKEGYQEAYDAALLGHVGPISSFTNYPNEGNTVFAGTGTPGVMLDHLYVNDQVTVLIHGVEPARVDGLFPSDHLPVLADLIL